MEGQEAKVIEVLDISAKSGVGKNGKAWSMARVGLDNKESAFIFNPIAVGDTVVAIKNGEYINWQKKRVNPEHEEIMKALRAIYKAVTVGEAAPALEEPKPKPEPKTDTVHPVNEGEPISLGDIPF